MSNEHTPNYSVIPPTGAFPHDLGTEKASDWPSKFVLPQGPSGSFSMGGWTELNEGFRKVSYQHLRAQETPEHLGRRSLLEKKKILKKIKKVYQKK